ncbi:MAG: DUF4743 domain-containing protein [Planctomycetes bacterium]|nr:DUF4743 domain-containing protein [Planctomycetota bacterium]
MLLPRLLERAKLCHTADPNGFLPWFVGEHKVGFVHGSREPLLATAGAPFVRTRGHWQLVGADLEGRSAALARFANELAQAGMARTALGELYPVEAPTAPAPLLAIDRAFVTWFGVRARGVHLNGLVRTPAGLRLWVAHRARDKRTFPGHLDNLVAGGQPFGLSPEQTLAKECHEEAGLPASLAAAARQVAVLHYTQQDGTLWKPDTLVCFDLDLPADVTPRPVDGEVEAFELWSVAQVVDSLAGDALWKPNCVLVVLDCLLRHGALDDRLTGRERLLLWHAVRGTSAG